MHVRVRKALYDWRSTSLQMMWTSSHLPNHTSVLPLPHIRMNLFCKKVHVPADSRRQTHMHMHARTCISTGMCKLGNALKLAYAPRCSTPNRNPSISPFAHHPSIHPSIHPFICPHLIHPSMHPSVHSSAQQHMCQRCPSVQLLE